MKKSTSSTKPAYAIESGKKEIIAGCAEIVEILTRAVRLISFRRLAVRLRCGAPSHPAKIRKARTASWFSATASGKGRFGGDPAILNKTLTLNGENYTVIGVMPQGFQFGREQGIIVDPWSPIVFTPQQLSANLSI